MQRLACLSITGCIKTAPTVALEAFLNLPPLHLFIEGEALNAALRLSDVSEWQISGKQTGHAVILDSSRLYNTETMAMRGDKTKPMFSFNAPFKTCIPSRDEWREKHSELLSDSCTLVYTDGSRMGENSGAGIFSSNFSEIIALGKYATVFQAEVVAITAAAYELLCSENLLNTIRILSDSQAAIKAVGAVRTTSKVVADCKKVLSKLAISKNVELIWIPGHCNFDGNEEADKLARQGSANKMTGPEPAVGISPAARRSQIKKIIHEKHFMSWQSGTDCRQAKQFFAGPSRKIEQFMLNSNRLKLRAISNTLTGHCLRLHLHRMGISDSVMCRGCGEAEENVEHFLCFCPALATKRALLLGDFFLTSDRIKIANLADIAKFVMSSGWLAQ